MDEVEEEGQEEVREVQEEVHGTPSRRFRRRSRSVSRESPGGPGGGAQTSAQTSVKMMRFTDYGMSPDCGKDRLRNGATDYGMLHGLRNAHRFRSARITES